VTDAGAHFVALEFSSTSGRDLRTLASEVRRGIAWLARDAGRFGGDPGRIYVGGFGSGAHLAAVALTTGWQERFDLPPDVIRASSA
jgi:arylformamidase